MFLCAYCLFFYFILFIILCVCGGGDVVTKRKIRILIWIQKMHDFSEVPFQCILND